MTARTDPDQARPVRIQLSRKKAWRMPENTVNVARPGRLGNPYPVAIYGLDTALKLFADSARGIWSPSNVAHLDDDLTQATYERHIQFRKRLGCHPVEYARACIAGKNVACWCGLDERCHGDIWLEIANR